MSTGTSAIAAIAEILSRLKIPALNPMQLATLEAAATHPNVLILSGTGTGKTLAYLLPVMQALDAGKSGTQAMIVAPSRELAIQIDGVFRSMGTGYKATCCYGGHLRETEEKNLLEAPTLIIGTPGRLGDHLRRKNIHPEGIHTLVLDEYDKILELGFDAELSFISEMLPAVARRMLASATRAAELPVYLNASDPAVIDFLTETVSPVLAMQVVRSADKDKLDSLFAFLCLAANRSAIVFCNHRESVERVSAWLSDKGLINVFYHGAMEQPERDSALCKFRNGTSNILITTDLASRGLDIPNIRYIVHYHLPVTQEVFTHRNGRTARMDASGTIVLLIGPDETVPPYLPVTPEEILLPDPILPDKPKWSTIFVAAGKKDKVNKVDIVGFFTQRGQLKKEDIGLIEVKDFLSFVAIRKSSVGFALQNIRDQKIKNKKVKINIAK